MEPSSFTGVLLYGYSLNVVVYRVYRCFLKLLKIPFPRRIILLSFMKRVSLSQGQSFYLCSVNLPPFFGYWGRVTSNDWWQSDVVNFGNVVGNLS
jgi:hypothetical protein